MNYSEKLSAQRILLIGGCGYIGSYLHGRLIECGTEVFVCDLGLRGNPLGVDVKKQLYWTLSDEDISGLDAVLWFAGHSSVGQSVSDPQGAIQNNCLRLFEFAQRLDSKTKFIYASSASLYSNPNRSQVPANESSLINIPAQNPYDISKFAFDYMATHFLKNYFGLRMGTLSGWSPNLRPELVFNAMNISAMRNGIVNLMNGTSCRTILFLEDLWVLIRSILVCDVEPGFVNAGSKSMTMQELANTIGSVWGAEVVDLGETMTYSFMLDCTKMHEICGSQLADRSFDSECRSFAENLNKVVAL